MCCYLLVSCKKVYQQINISPAKRFLLHPLKANSSSKRQCFRCYGLVGKPKKQGVNSALDMIRYWGSIFQLSESAWRCEFRGSTKPVNTNLVFLWLKHWRLFKGCSIMVLNGKAPCGWIHWRWCLFLLRIFFKKKHTKMHAHTTQLPTEICMESTYVTCWVPWNCVKLALQWFIR